jgi:branched-chain amino acid transport system ATP-binding protein
MTDVLLDVSGLRAGYESTTVLHGVDLRVNTGELSVVIGPNGHGKTTLLRAASGLVSPSAGRITLAGQDITRMRPEAIAARGLVHIPQGDLLFPDMTVLENLTLGAFLRRGGRAERAQQLSVVYDIFPRLAERSTQRARTLSGGERRMLALGRGLMAEARMLMVDEPSLGLAPVLVDEVYRQIGRIGESGMTILLVEENFSRVRDLADRLTLIENGQVRASGTVQEVLADPAVAATYLGIES